MLHDDSDMKNICISFAGGVGGGDNDDDDNDNYNRKMDLSGRYACQDRLRW